MNEKQEVTPVWNEKEQAPTTQEQDHAPTDHPPEGETQTTEGNTPKKLQECHPIAPPCRHENEGKPEPTSHEQVTEGEPESEKTDLTFHQVPRGRQTHRTHLRQPDHPEQATLFHSQDRKDHLPRQYALFRNGNRKPTRQDETYAYQRF